MTNKVIKILFPVLLIASMTGCKKYLDINSDPDTPQFPDASSVFPAMLSGIPRGTQFDARYVSKYIQNFAQSTSGAATVIWDKHGHQNYPNISDVGGDIWRQAYFGLGANLNYIIDQGKVKGQWDYVGAGYALKALLFQMCADEYGDIIYKEAFKENTSVFKYDGQETSYLGVDSLCRLALENLSRSDLNPSNSLLAKGDFVYNGDRTKWIKLTHAILAQNFHRYTNKPGYTTRFADSVILHVNAAFASGNDDFLIPFDATKNDDTNFFGSYRDNLTTFRQTKWIVSLLDGSFFNGSTTYVNRDPRLRHMLVASHDSTNGNGGYRGVDPGLGDVGAGNTRVPVPFFDTTYVNPAVSRFDPTKGKYLFRDKAVSPVISYSQLQFMKAEAYFRKNGGPNADAYTAYIAGIQGHFDFINRGVYPRSGTPLFQITPVTATERNAYMASGAVKQTAGALTLTDIMLQKYIALWGWGFNETWVDMRRFHYTDPDPTTLLPVYRGFIIPADIPAANNGQLAYRIRPRYNSEYVWNFEEMVRIGATAPDYHTKRVWFSEN
jgi:hypothetical protein